MTGRVVGIDPGLLGAVAVVDGDELVAVHPMPTTLLDGRTVTDGRGLCDLLVAIGQVRMVVVERIPGLGPGIGKSSAMSLGWSLGVIHGVLGATARPTSTVTPAEWRRAARIVTPQGSSSDGLKRLSLARAGQLWPDRRWRRRDDGIAEAALMAWGWNRG